MSLHMCDSVDTLAELKPVCAALDTPACLSSLSPQTVEVVSGNVIIHSHAALETKGVHFLVHPEGSLTITAPAMSMTRAEVSSEETLHPRAHITIRSMLGKRWPVLFSHYSNYRPAPGGREWGPQERSLLCDHGSELRPECRV